jgi:hypothetical protein
MLRIAIAKKRKSKAADDPPDSVQAGKLPLTTEGAGVGGLCYYCPQCYKVNPTQCLKVC